MATRAKHLVPLLAAGLLVLAAPAVAADVGPTASPVVDFNADGIADHYELSEEFGEGIQAWFGRPHGSRVVFTPGTDVYAEDTHRAVAATTPDGHTELLLHDDWETSTSLAVLTDAGINMLSIDPPGNGLAEPQFGGSIIRAQWEDVNADGWPDITVLGYPCYATQMSPSGCLPVSFAWLQRQDRTFVLESSLRLNRQEGYGPYPASGPYSSSVMRPGDSLTMRVRLASVPSRPEPTGTVTFSSLVFCWQLEPCETQLGEPVPVRGGRATARVPVTMTGGQTIVARYSGDAHHRPSTSSPALLSVLRPAELVLQGADSPTAPGEPWTGVVELQGLPPEPGLIPSSGRVDLVLDGVPQPCCTFLEQGRFTFSFPHLAPGRHTLEITYGFAYAREEVLDVRRLRLRHRVLAD